MHALALLPGRGRDERLCSVLGLQELTTSLTLISMENDKLRCLAEQHRMGSVLERDSTSPERISTVSDGSSEVSRHSPARSVTPEDLRASPERDSKSSQRPSMETITETPPVTEETARVRSV